MKIGPVVSAIALFLLVALPASADDCVSPGSLTFSSALNGSRFGGGGAPAGFGTATLTIDPVASRGSVHAEVGGIGTNITSFALYRVGQLAPVVVFTSSGDEFDGNTFRGDVDLGADVVNGLLARPTDYFFRIDTGEYPDGAVSGALRNQQTFGGAFSGAAVVGSTGIETGGGAFSAWIMPSASGGTLYYSVAPAGIGASITRLDLRQGGAGSNGALFATLAENAVLQNGLIVGSIPLTATQVRLLMANPSGYHLVATTAANPNGAIRAQFAGTPYEYYFPVAGSTAGALGSQWRTDLRIFNPSPSTPATVLVQMLPTGRSNGTSDGAMDASIAASVVVPPQASLTIDSATTALFGSRGAGLGALRLISDSAIVPIARIFDSTRGAENALTADAIEAVTACDATMRGILAGIASSPAGDNALALRTNLGFFNPNPFPVMVRLDLLAGDGGSGAPQATLVLEPFMQRQLPMIGTGGVFEASSTLRDGTVTFNASAPILAYSSVVNSASGDAHIAMAVANPVVAVPLVEGEIAGILIAANQAEADVSSAVRPRLTDAAVKAYANQMVAEHLAAVESIRSGAAAIGVTPAESATSNFLRGFAQQAIARIEGMAQGAPLDRAFIEAQITAHRTFLETIDQVLLPASKSQQMRVLLTTQRATAAAHMAAAQQILSGLSAP